VTCRYNRTVGVPNNLKEIGLDTLLRRQIKRVIQLLKLMTRASYWPEDKNFEHI